jgi:uridine kinase
MPFRSCSHSRSKAAISNPGRTATPRPPGSPAPPHPLRRQPTPSAAHPVGRQTRPGTVSSTEGFHLPRAQRYRRGEFSPEANYHDSFDYDALRRVLLDPLGPDGDRRCQRAVYDFDTDTALSPPVTTATADAVLVLDGVFLLRPELIDRWDLSIRVSARSTRHLDRARIRDLARLGSTAEVERRFRTRYIAAQELYLATARPTDHADIIVYNDEPRLPAWEVRPH